MKIENKIKNMLDGINDSSDITEKNISELQGIAKDYPNWNTQREKNSQDEKGGITELWDFKWHNILVIWDPKGGLGQKTYLKK